MKKNSLAFALLVVFFTANSTKSIAQGPVNGLQSIGINFGIGGTLSQNTNINTGIYSYKATKGHAELGLFDTTMYLVGSRLSNVDNSTLFSGITRFGSVDYSNNLYHSSNFNIIHGFTASANNADIVYYRDFSIGNFGNFGFHDYQDGLIGVMETRKTTNGLSYGFSTHNATGSTSADFFEYNKLLDLDQKYIYVTPDNIIANILHTITDGTHYHYNDLILDSVGFTYRLQNFRNGGSTTVGYNSFGYTIVGSTVNMKVTLPQYPAHTNADSDGNLCHGCEYKLNGDRVIYQKP